MYRTTVRVFLKNDNTQYSVMPPEGIRRMVIYPLTRNVLVLWSFKPNEVEIGNGKVATLDEPFDTGLMFKDTGPVYLATDGTGIWVVVEVFHTRPFSATPGTGGGSQPPLELVPHFFIPTEEIADENFD